MAQADNAPHSPPEAPRRPKGILKNSNSFQRTSPEASVSPTSAPPTQNNDHAVDGSHGRPSMPARELSEKEITLMNTELNAGAGHRRNSSNPRSSISRRQSSQSGGADGMQDDQGMRLKWDEANLYLNEGQMGGKMKIDEPKTPYAKQYDPTEDDEDMSLLNPSELAVDELEMEKSRQPQRRTARESEIPGLDLGEPEMDPDASRQSDGENKVIVASDDMDVDGTGHGEKTQQDMSREEWEKHKQFEERRKRHYEMRNIKDLLGHPEDVDVDEDDEREDDGKMTQDDGMVTVTITDG